MTTPSPSMPAAPIGADPAPVARLYPRPTRRLRAARSTVVVLNATTIAVFFGCMVWLMHFNGIVLAEWLMLVPFALTLPWLSIGFWNALIGLWLSRRHDDAAVIVNPALARARKDAPLREPVAIVMPVRNEPPDMALSRFEALQREITTSPHGRLFEFHVLSDSDDPAIAAAEEARVAAWQARAPRATIGYRRRARNSGFKAGNIAEFLSRRHADFTFLLPLDADSTMRAGAVFRLLRVMEANPRLGMLQGLVVGTPASSFFTRAFQFGMRHGMRSFTLGSAWWQGDCGPSWGHNMIIRTRPFYEHCLLPKLPGKGPLSGDILSHDQVEATLMRRAGFDVRVLADEDESYEDNPPSLPDFIKREMRWCHGNLQYFKLLGMPGLKPVSRIQLVLAILMYTSAPAWIVFLALGTALAGIGGQFEGVPIAAGLGFFAAIMTVNLMPKIMGLMQVLLSSRESARYGGRLRVMAGGAIELVFSFLIAPVVALSLTIGIVRLFAGRKMSWGAQTRRRDAGLTWREGIAAFWPHTLAGLAMAAYLGAAAPGALAFASPVLAALIFAIPVAVLTTRPSIGAWTVRTGLFAVPEEIGYDRTGTPPALPVAA